MKVTRCQLAVAQAKCLKILNKLSPNPSRGKPIGQPKSYKYSRLRLHCLASKLRLAKSMGRKCASVSCRCHCHQTTTTRSSLRHLPQPQTQVRVQVRVRVRVRFPVESFPHCRRQSGSSSRKAKKNDYGTLCK